MALSIPLNEVAVPAPVFPDDQFAHNFAARAIERGGLNLETGSVLENEPARVWKSDYTNGVAPSARGDDALRNIFQPVADGDSHPVAFRSVAFRFGHTAARVVTRTHAEKCRNGENSSHGAPQTTGTGAG